MRLCLLSLLLSTCLFSVHAGSERLAAVDSNGLRAWFSLTKDEARVRRDWERGAAAPELLPIDRARAGDLVSTVTTFKGCSPNRTGNCELTAKFSIEMPTGQRIEAGGCNLWSSRPLEGQTMLGAVGARLPVAGNWMAGRYVVHVTITDHVASRAVDLAAPFEVAP